MSTHIINDVSGCGVGGGNLGDRGGAIDVMNYILGIFSLRSFKKNPIMVLKNSLLLAFRILTRSGSVITVKFGSTAFKFSYVHGARHGGGRGFFIERQYLEDLMEYGDRFIRMGDVVIDGGANQGVFTVAFANYVGTTGKVIAVEPMKYAAELTGKNLNLNQCTNTEIVIAGLSDQVGSATLDLSRGVGAATIISDYGKKQSIEIETTTIDVIVHQFRLQRCDFIKLDIEGAELKALNGAKNTIARFNPVICMEIWDEFDWQVQAHSHLLRLGYEPWHFHDNVLQKLPGLKPPHPNIFYIRQPAQNCVA